MQRYKKIGEKGLSLVNIPITSKDPYNSRNKKVQFDMFLKGSQDAVKNKNLEDLLMRIFSQFIKPSVLKDIIDYIDFVEYIVTGNLDTQLKILKENLKIYKSFVTLYHANLVSKEDEKNTALDFSEKLGTIPYLATVSHSLSQTKLWNDLEKELKSAFSSGENLGYKR